MWQHSVGDFEVREPLQIILMETGQQANRNLENKPTGVLKKEEQEI